MPADPAKSNLYADKESGLIRRIDRVDERYAYVTVLQALPSKYSMPVIEYDSTFMGRHTVIDAGDMRLPDGYRPPANATDVEIREPGIDDERGETAEGVRIGDEEVVQSY